MNLLKQLWNFLVLKTSHATEATPVLVEDTTEEIDLRALFVQVCTSKGMGDRPLRESNAVELFLEWYDGEPTYEAILACMPEFMAQNNVVNAKFQRFFG
jgi:hypothetical protein